jgi:SLIT-ROBO Rho GTPase activating protein
VKRDGIHYSRFLSAQCREIGYETHEEILRVLHELHTTMKTYNNYQGECRQAENKLRIVENQRQKLEQTVPHEKLDRSKKFRLIEKEVQKVSNSLLVSFVMVRLRLRVS